MFAGGLRGAPRGAPTETRRSRRHLGESLWREMTAARREPELGRSGDALDEAGEDGKPWMLQKKTFQKFPTLTIPISGFAALFS